MIVEAVKEILKPEEKYERFVYQDSKKYWTIGYGLCVQKGVGEGLTEMDADYLLGVSVRRRIEALQKVISFWSRLPELAQVVITCMAYQMGVNGVLGFPKFLQAASVGDWKTAHDEMLDSQWAREDSPARANRMADMILTLIT
jgi:lysozyme